MWEGGSGSQPTFASSASAPEYSFFPASADSSRAAWAALRARAPLLEVQQVDEVDEVEEADLASHLDYALNLATGTWTQDPYRSLEQPASDGRPTFDIDFSKNPKVN